MEEGRQSWWLLTFCLNNWCFLPSISLWLCFLHNDVFTVKEIRHADLVKMKSRHKEQDFTRNAIISQLESELIWQRSCLQQKLLIQKLDDPNKFPLFYAPIRFVFAFTSCENYTLDFFGLTCLFVFVRCWCLMGLIIKRRLQVEWWRHLEGMRTQFQSSQKGYNIVILSMRDEMRMREKSRRQDKPPHTNEYI